SYQWRFNGVDIAGATGSSYQIGRAITNLAGNYSVVVSNAFGVVSSAKATVTIIQLVAWGAGTNVVISSPNFQQSLLPTGIGPVTNIAGGYYHSLAIQPDGRVLAWGAGTNNTGLNPN